MGTWHRYYCPVTKAFYTLTAFSSNLRLNCCHLDYIMTFMESKHTESPELSQHLHDQD